jgi:hypothetical protein
LVVRTVEMKLCLATQVLRPKRERAEPRRR